MQLFIKCTVDQNYGLRWFSKSVGWVFRRMISDSYEKTNIGYSSGS